MLKLVKFLDDDREENGQDSNVLNEVEELEKKLEDTVKMRFKKTMENFVLQQMIEQKRNNIKNLEKELEYKKRQHELNTKVTNGFKKLNEGAQKMCIKFVESKINNKKFYKKKYRELNKQVHKEKLEKIRDEKKKVIDSYNDINIIKEIKALDLQIKQSKKRIVEKKKNTEDELKNHQNDFIETLDERNDQILAFVQVTKHRQDKQNNISYLQSEIKHYLTTAAEKDKVVVELEASVEEAIFNLQKENKLSPEKEKSDSSDNKDDIFKTPKRIQDDSKNIVKHSKKSKKNLQFGAKFLMKDLKASRKNPTLTMRQPILVQNRSVISNHNEVKNKLPEKIEVLQNIEIAPALPSFPLNSLQSDKEISKGIFLESSKQLNISHKLPADSSKIFVLSQLSDIEKIAVVEKNINDTESDKTIAEESKKKTEVIKEKTKPIIEDVQKIIIEEQNLEKIDDERSFSKTDKNESEESLKKVKVVEEKCINKPVVVKKQQLVIEEKNLNKVEATPKTFKFKSPKVVDLKPPNYDELKKIETNQLLASIKRSEVCSQLMESDLESIEIDETEEQLDKKIRDKFLSSDMISYKPKEVQELSDADSEESKKLSKSLSPLRSSPAIEIQKRSRSEGTAIKTKQSKHTDKKSVSNMPKSTSSKKRQNLDRSFEMAGPSKISKPGPSKASSSKKQSEKSPSKEFDNNPEFFDFLEFDDFPDVDNDDFSSALSLSPKSRKSGSNSPLLNFDFGSSGSSDGNRKSKRKAGETDDFFSFGSDNDNNDDDDFNFSHKSKNKKKLDFSF